MLRDAVRQLDRTPGYTGFAIGLLALGFGTAIAIAAVVDAVLWRPLPVRDPDRVVQISEVNAAAGIRTTETSRSTAADWMTYATSFAGIAAVERLPAGAAIATDLGTTTVAAADVTWNFFEVIGAPARLGRTFAREYEDGVVISHRVWQSWFGGRPDAVGTMLTIDGVRAPVIGVMPRGFALPGRTEVWRSAQTIRPHASGGWRGSGDRHERTIEVIARLKPATTLERAEAEMQVIASEIAARFPQSNRGWGIQVRPLADAVSAPIKPVVIGVTIAGALLVIVTAASALTLALAHAWLRRGTLAVQAALGASPSRLFAEILVGRLLVAGSGSAAGLLAGLAGVRLLESRLSALVPALDDLPVGPPIVAGLVTGAGALAVLEAVILYLRCRPRDRDVLRGDSLATSGDLQPLRTYGIIGLQVALSVVLMAVGIETSRQMLAFRHQDRGYRPAHLVVARFIPEEVDGFFTRRAYQESMLRTVSSQPWARSAALVTTAPFAGETWARHVVTAASSGQTPAVTADYSVVSDSFFDVLETPLLAGRRFDDRDNISETQAVERDGHVESVLINRSLAQGLFGTASAAGQAIRHGRRSAIVVGIVEDTRLFPGRAQSRPEIFGTFRQHNGPYHLTLVVRTAPSHSPLPIDRMLRGTLPTVGFFNVHTASGIIDAAIPLQRVSSLLIQLFAAIAIALTLASLGALVTLVVRSSRRALAIRLVLGARPRDVIGVVGKRAAWSLGIGGAAGLAMSSGVGQWLVATGYWPQSPSLVVLGAGTLLLMTVEAIAILVPGREAVRIDPISTLKLS